MTDRAQNDAVQAVPSATRIWEAALELFADKGFHATGIRDIAALAGVHTSVLYHYAASKADLLAQLMNDGITRYRAAAVRCVDEARLPEEKLVALVLVQVIINGRYRRMARILGHEQAALPPALRAGVLEATGDVERLWSDTISSGVDEGVFTVESQQMARLALLRMAAGVYEWYSEAGALSIEEIARVFADLALGLVRARRDGRPLGLGDLERPQLERLTAIIEEEHGPADPPR